MGKSPESAWESLSYEKQENIDKCIRLLNFNEEIRIESSNELIKIGLPAVNRLIHDYEYTTPNVKLEELYILGRIRHKAATKFLLQVLQDTEEKNERRAQAAGSLGLIGSKEAIDTLISVLADLYYRCTHSFNDMHYLSTSNIRIAIVECLAKYGGKKAIEAIKYAAKDKDLMVSGIAEHKLKELEVADHSVKKNQQNVVIKIEGADLTTVKMLEETGGKKAVKFLNKLFKNASDPGVRKAARKAIDKIKK